MRESTRKYIKELEDWFSRSQNILLVCHTNPDGDAIGSMLGLYHYFRLSGKDCMMVSPSPLQQFLTWLEDADKIMVAERNLSDVEAVVEKTDLIVMLDFNHLSRLGLMEDTIAMAAAPKVLIDHHPDPSIKADLRISEPRFSSTAELVFDLVSHLNGSELFEPGFIEALYVGMMTDTGNFSFGSYDGGTLRVVAGMLENGLRKDYISDMVYDNFSADRMRLKGYALSQKMVVLHEYRTAYIVLTEAELKSFNHAVGDTEGFVNLPLSIRGIDFSVLFLEKRDHVKLSLRSRGKIDVNSVSKRFFNGGGHRNAAGGKDSLPVEKALERFRKILDEIKVELTAGNES